MLLSQPWGLMNSMDICVLDDSNFKELVALYNLTVIQEEDQYYILDGTKEDLKLFSSDWSLGL